jgi:hypothetical protein
MLRKLYKHITSRLNPCLDVAITWQQQSLISRALSSRGELFAGNLAYAIAYNHIHLIPAAVPYASNLTGNKCKT